MRRSSSGAIGVVPLTLISLIVACGGGGLVGGDSTARSGTATAERTPAAVERLALRVVATHPHDRQAFTQGLLWHDGSLYESTGRYGRSTLREIELERGRIVRSASLPEDLFAEGLAVVGEELVQLTWRAETALVWSLADLEIDRRLRYSGEGWGLCFDGDSLVMSDGSSRLVLRDPNDLRISRRVDVERAGIAVPFLNELECVDGTVYANVWMSDEIVRIDPSTGAVTGVVDASGLLTPAERAAADVLNGIAYRPERGTFLLTGKYWPKLFEVEITSSPGGRGPGDGARATATAPTRSG